MDEFLRELFYYCQVENGDLDEYTKEFVKSLLETWGEIDRTGKDFEEWLNENDAKEDFEKFKEVLGV